MARVAIGSKIDKLYKMIEEKRVLTKKVLTLEEKIKELEAEVKTVLKKDKLEGGSGDRAQSTIGFKHIPIIEDPKKFRSFVLRNKALSLYQSRLSVKAIEEMVEHRRRPIPGIGYLKVEKLYTTKRESSKKKAAKKNNK